MSLATKCVSCILGTVMFAFCISATAAPPNRRANLLANGGFELGRDNWRIDRDKGTEAKFETTADQVAAGQQCARVTVQKVVGWGTQFGQSLEAPAPGKTYTFAALVRSTGKPVTVQLEIERSANPWDRAARSDKFTVTRDKWTELHVTFKLDKPFPQGWFAYISCAQGDCEYLADEMRIYEGEYAPFKAGREEDADAFPAVAVYDTLKSSATPLAGEALIGKTGWTEVKGGAGHTFKGDMVLANDYLALVVRRGAKAAEAYAAGASGFVQRADLLPADAGAAVLKSFDLVRTADSATARCTFTSSDGKTFGLDLALVAGQAYVRTQPRQATSAIRIQAPCGTVVLPDFFADDIIVEAGDVSAASAELPNDHFLIHLLGRGECLLLSVASQRGDDVRIDLSGQGEGRRIDASRVPFGKDGKVFVALLEAPGIWHRRQVARADAGKILQLDWKQPFDAVWRVDWRRSDGLIDSWEMLCPRKSGGYDKLGWYGDSQSVPPNRKKWTTVLGSFLYPCWADLDGRAFLQPLKGPFTFDGPAVIYPINRSRATAPDIFTVQDILRAALGVGPCQFILDVEGQGTSLHGRPTCGTRDLLGPIYRSGQQKQKRAEIEKALVDVVTFVKFIRARIEDYVAWGHELVEYLREQKKAHPELAGFADEMIKLARDIDVRYDRRREPIRTPQYVIDLTEKFRRTLLDYEGGDAYAKCKAITEAIVVVGGNQDELVGECRLAVKVIRQRAGLAMADDPKVAELAKEIRLRAQKILRNPTSYEAPRH